MTGIQTSWSNIQQSLIILSQTASGTVEFTLFHAGSVELLFTQLSQFDISDV